MFAAGRIIGGIVITLVDATIYMGDRYKGRKGGRTGHNNRKSFGQYRPLPVTFDEEESFISESLEAGEDVEAQTPTLRRSRCADEFEWSVEGLLMGALAVGCVLGVVFFVVAR